MTDEAGTTWALVVGIDRYDHPSLRPLDGAVADAVAAVRWLHALGVPAGQTLLHAVPSDAARAALDQMCADLDITYADAYERTLWRSVNRLVKETTGTRLFVFLSGHGLYEPTSQRLFLTQEAGVDDVFNNLGIDKYVQLLLSGNFRRTFLFLDGCQNYPYTETKRQQIEGGMFGGAVPPTGRPENWLAACFAASQGQRAAEIDGRGAFLHRLLAALDLTRPFVDAVDLDFDSGRLSVDLRRVIGEDVRPAVEAAAGALSPPVHQRPQLLTYGALGADAPCPVMTLPAVATGDISIDLAPPDALSAVEMVDFRVQWKPWTLRRPRPRGTALQVPIRARVPVGECAEIRCVTVPGTPWNVVHPILTVSVEGDHPVRFELTSPGVTEPEFGAPPGPTEHIGVKLLTRDGEQAPLLNDHDYDRIGEAIGIPLTHGLPTPVAPGVLLHPHETGPELEVGAGAEGDGGRLAATLAEVLREIVPADVVVATAASARLPAAPASLELRLPEGGATTIAGPLARSATLAIEVPGDDTPWESLRQIPLADLDAVTRLEVPPGRLHLRLDLPWGSWRSSIEAHVRETSVVALPAVIGIPPLRVRLGTRGWPAGYAVVGVESDIPRGRIRAGILDNAARPMAAVAHDDGAWVLAAEDDLAAQPHRGGWMAMLVDGGGRATVFPLRPVRSLAVDGVDAEAKVEPLTDVPLAEWDLLVSTGEIEDIDPDGLTALVGSVALDEVLGLAAAYALHARARWEHLRSLVDELRRREWLGLDVDLLTRSLDVHTGARDTRFADRLAERAGRGEVPILRWGVALALRLAAPDDARLDAWRAKLEQIDRTLSPRSVWTVWTEPAS